MILELGDGRELQFPDDMPDETARQLKRFILTLEERAAAAESQARTLTDEMAAMRQTFAQARVESASQSETAAAVRDMHQAIQAGLDRIEKAARSDRFLLEDDYGRPISRVR